MDKLRIINKIKEIYINGGNMMEFLRDKSKGKNDIESILISYDFQAGSYIKMVSENSVYINSYVCAILKELKNLGPCKSILEIGVGEATLMSPLMQKLDPENKILKFGFDISWSRIRFGQSHAANFNQNLTLFTSNLFDIPFPDSCIDIVYTSHSLEPNGGNEKKALEELYRVAKNYIVLLEPDYESCSQEAKERMTKHGYVKNLAKNAKELGYEVIMNRSFEVFSNPLNPTRLTIIKKNSIKSNIPEFLCPITNTKLIKLNGHWYSKEAGLLYPEIDGIPCLIEQQAILATKYLNFNAR
jgi:ubiquinone/menaquinone biosynthesis C-methylase UbiE